MQKGETWILYIVIGTWIVLGTRGVSLSRHQKPTAFERIEKINSRFDKYNDHLYYQGDTKLPRNPQQHQRSQGSNLFNAAIRGDNTNLWPNGIIPYTVAYHIKKNAKKYKILENAMEEWEKKTCIRFVERTTQTDYVEFYHGEGCNSDVGRVGGRQTTSLGGGCAHHSIIVHELGHVIGFWHEQNRPDRDKHVEIVWENIIPKFQFAFTKYNNKKIDSLGVPYDYYSVMHYGSKAFSKNHKPTIRSRKADITEFGSAHISQYDAKQANLLYNCPDYPEFPKDFFWKTNGPVPAGSECVRFYEPKDRYNWRRSYLCYRKDRMALDIQFSHNGAVEDKECIQTAAHTKNQDVWFDNHFCWSRYGVYKFTWLTSRPSPSQAEKCLNITNPRDPEWSQGEYYLCADKDQKPVDGQWSPWASWTTCSRPCGGGLQSRARTCSNPRPSYRGKYCVGDSLQRQRCNEQKCEEWPSFPSDFSYGKRRFISPDDVCVRTYERLDYFQWTNYVFCSPNNKRDPEFSWSDHGPIPNMLCTRIYVPKEVEKAKRKGSWDDNYLCMKDDSSPYRFRFSYNGPIPGLDCMQWYAKDGKDGWDKTFLCNERTVTDHSRIPEVARPINGQWSSWEGWQACSKSCGGGVQKRMRKCNNPIPSNGGRTCRGRDLDERACNIKSCPHTCSGTYVADGGRFTSPDFPLNYPDNSDCTWLIKVAEGKIISLRFNYFDVEGPICTYDWIAIHDGPSVKYPLLGKFCGSTIPATVRSTGHYMWIKFKTDDRTSHKGFDISWTSLQDPTSKRIPRCGGHVTRSTGSLTSPGFPTAYPGAVDCTWVITGDRGKRLQVWFDHFDIENSHECRADYVHVRDGKTELATSLGKKCGRTAPGPFKSLGDSIRLTLHSNGQTERSGFRIRWRSVDLGGRHATPAPTPAANDCPPGWISHSFGEHVYCYLIKRNYHTWFEARRHCMSSISGKYKADLLSVLSKEEENFVIKDLNPRHNLGESFMWLGLNDRLREGEWAWSDRQETQKYINWAPGDPNDGGYLRNEDCGVLKPDGTWNDYPCNSRFRYICKTQAV